MSCPHTGTQNFPEKCPPPPTLAPPHQEMSTAVGHASDKINERFWDMDTKILSSRYGVYLYPSVGVCVWGGLVAWMLNGGKHCNSHAACLIELLY